MKEIKDVESDIKRPVLICRKWYDVGDKYKERKLVVQASATMARS